MDNSLPTTCCVCSRNPRDVNNEVAECSHVDCPHRRCCWSDGTAAYGRWSPRPPARDERDALFDRQDV